MSAGNTIEHLNIEALSALADDAPVVMLNLMRFRERSLGWIAGASSCHRYVGSRLTSRMSWPQLAFSRSGIRVRPFT